MRRFKLCLTVIFFVVLKGSLFAQTAPDPTLQVGLQPFQSYDATNTDAINLATGFLSLNIPIVSFPQRGALHLDYEIGYVNPTVTFYTLYGDYRYYGITAPGLNFGNDAFPVEHLNDHRLKAGGLIATESRRFAAEAA